MNALRDSMLSAQGYREEWEIPNVNKLRFY